MFVRDVIALPVAALAIGLCLCEPVVAVVLSRDIINEPSGVAEFTWGDGVHDLFQQWSVAEFNRAGWAYGSNYMYTSNADVANAGSVPVHTIADAAAYNYTSSTRHFEEGDVVLFRGRNGYWGAWKIIDVRSQSLPGPPYDRSFLDATWYFQTDGSASFVPEPAGAMMLVIAPLALSTRRGRRT